MELSPHHSGHASRNTRFGWKPLPSPGDISNHLPNPSGLGPALLHAWHPRRAANHREFQVLRRHLAWTAHPTSSCALSISQHPGSSFPRKRGLPTPHHSLWHASTAIGAGSSSSLSSGSRQDLVLLDLPAEMWEKKGKYPQNIYRSSGVTLQDDQQVTGRGRRAAQPCRVPHTQTPSNPDVPSFVSSHVRMVLESSGKIGQAARWMVLGEQPTGQALL